MFYLCPRHLKPCFHLPIIGFLMTPPPGGLVVADSGLLTEDNLDEYIKDYNTVNISTPKELADFCNACADIMENSDDWEKRIVAVSY